MARSAAPMAPALVVLLMSAMATTALAFAPPFAPLLAPVGPSARAATPGGAGGAHPRLRSRLPPARPSLLPPGRHACGVHKRRQSLQWSVQMAADGAGDPGEGITATDREYMDRALELARQGEGRTFPNPCVGCVLVKDGEVVGEGFHPKAGMPHAEIYALYMAGERAKGATAYVTLEPCNHFGRTPPCSQAFVDAQVSRVVVAMRDPNPLVNSQGIATLQSNAVRVDVMDGPQAQQARELTADFVERITAPAPATPAAAVSDEADKWGGELAPLLDKAIDVVQQGLRDGTVAGFADAAAASLSPSCAPGSAADNAPEGAPGVVTALSGSHYMLECQGEQRWVIVTDEGETGGRGEAAVAVSLLDKDGECLLAVIGNARAREEACVMAAVRGEGLRYFARKGSSDTAKPGHRPTPTPMALSSSANLRRCWDQTALDRPTDELPLVQVLSGAAAAPTGRNDQADGAKKGLLNHYWQLTQGQVAGLLVQEDIDKDTWQAELLRHTPGMLCVTEAGGSARYHRLRFNFPGAAEDERLVGGGGGVVAIAPAGEELAIGESLRSYLVAVLGGAAMDS